MGGTEPSDERAAAPEVRKRVQESFDRQGLMSHLGARITLIAPGRVHIELPRRPELTQQHGYFHAGASSAIADSAGGYAGLTLFDEDSDVLTVEYKLNLLAPAVGDRLLAAGTVIRSGRTLTVCRLEVYGVTGTEHTLVANGQQTLIRITAPGGG